MIFALYFFVYKYHLKLATLLFRYVLSIFMKLDFENRTKHLSNFGRCLWEYADRVIAKVGHPYFVSTLSGIRQKYTFR